MQASERTPCPRCGDGTTPLLSHRRGAGSRARDASFFLYVRVRSHVPGARERVRGAAASGVAVAPPPRCVPVRVAHSVPRVETATTYPLKRRQRPCAAARRGSGSGLDAHGERRRRAAPPARPPQLYHPVRRAARRFNPLPVGVPQTSSPKQTTLNARHRAASRVLGRHIWHARLQPPAMRRATRGQATRGWMQAEGCGSRFHYRRFARGEARGATAARFAVFGLRACAADSAARAVGLTDRPERAL